MKILCWNVNGIRAVQKKGFLEWMQKESPDIICVQETKAHPEQLDKKLLQPEGYHTYWNHPEKKGYSGVAIFTKEEPEKVQYGFDIDLFDTEGRVIMSQYAEITIFNIYFPNGKKDNDRLQYKMDFYEIFLQYAEQIRKDVGRVIVCGDFNTAHKEIDLARPKQNEKVSGFLPEERAWIDKFIDHGWVDTFRYFNKEPEQYTWWDLKSGARERNVGWRLDYFFTTDNLIPSLADAFIMPDVMGSDHCPIGIVLK